jgi:hypothetical protein
MLGIIFFVPIFGLVVGTAMGSLTGSMADFEINDAFIKSVSSKVTEGTSALFLLTTERDIYAIERTQTRHYSFPGVIGRCRPVRTSLTGTQGTKENASNVLFIILDDTGFGQFGFYGSPIQTPNLNDLVTGALAYTNMHTTEL